MPEGKNTEVSETKRTRELSSPYIILFKIISACFSLFYLYTAGFGIISTETQRGMYLLFTLVLSFMLFPMTRRSSGNRPTLLDWAFIVLTLASFGYWMQQYYYYVWRVGEPTFLDTFFGVAAIVLLLEVQRRVLGKVLIFVAIVFFLQLYFGPYLPGTLKHPGFTWVRIIEFTYSRMEAIFGIITDTFASYVFPFIILGAFFEKSGAGDFFLRLAMSLTGRWTGGPAKVATVASGLFGSISGSSVANVMATGVLTIPIMKRLGYQRHDAGGIEAAASTGGNIMPPVMGAGAFVLATITETPYRTIMLMGIIPALLYYFYVGVMVHLEAKRLGLRGMSADEIPPLMETLKRGWFFFTPYVVIVGVIMAGYSAGYGAFWAVVATVIVSTFRKETRMSPRTLFEALAKGGQNNLVVGSCIGTLGIIMGAIVLAGLGPKLAAILVSLSYGHLWLLVAMVGVIATIVGMGANTIATYIIIAMVAGTALIQLGVDKVTAHLVCFWTATFSNVTPPVCIAAYAAAGIAETNPMRTGVSAMKFSLMLYLLPVAFVYFPEVLGLGDPTAITFVVLRITASIFILAIAIEGFLLRKLSLFIQVLIFACFIMVFASNLLFNGLGVLGFLALLLIERKATKKMQQMESIVAR